MFTVDLLTAKGVIPLRIEQSYTNEKGDEEKHIVIGVFSTAKDADGYVEQNRIQLAFKLKILGWEVRKFRGFSPINAKKEIDKINRVNGLKKISKSKSKKTNVYN